MRLREAGVGRERSANEPESEISKVDTEVTSEDGCSLRSFSWNQSKLSFNEIYSSF